MGTDNGEVQHSPDIVGVIPDHFGFVTFADMIYYYAIGNWNKPNLILFRFYLGARTYFLDKIIGIRVRLQGLPLEIFFQEDVLRFEIPVHQVSWNPGKSPHRNTNE